MDHDQHHDVVDAAPGADDNALAKAAGATPFKRPENGVFRPGSNFHEYYFDETGDTDNRTCAGGGPAPNPNQPACTSPNQTGGFGSIFKLVQSPTSDNGSISVLYDGDQVHSAFDNTAFFSKNNIAFVEDAGDTLHTQRNALDSAWMFDVTQDYSHGAQPVRFIAEGRDASATIDSGPRRYAGLPERGRQRDHRHVRLGRRHEHPRAARGGDAPAVQERQVAGLLDAAAR